ncbi:hypothetical protein ScPMuIL_010715 [Solemya velum]
MNLLQYLDEEDEDIYMEDKEPDQILTFIKGGVGSDKSHLIKALYQMLTKTLRSQAGNPEEVVCLLTAPTGTAARNIYGYHSAFNTKNDFGTTIGTPANMGSKPSIYLTVTAGKENAETYVKSPYWDWFSGVVHRKVSTVAAHPAFDDSSLTNDIAILRLSRPLPKTNKIKPVDRLATPLDNVVGNHECFIAGFGAVHVEDVDGDIRSVPATTLQKANVPIIENHACTGLIEGINHSRICVFEVKGGRASCFGDSGGPLTCNIAGKWVLVGLTSYGFTTCSAPSVYTRVSSYQDWLEEHGVL